MASRRGGAAVPALETREGAPASKAQEQAPACILASGAIVSGGQG